MKSEILISIPNVIGKLLQQVWLQDKKAAENALRTVSEVISNCNRLDGIKMIGAVAQFIPSEMMIQMVWAAATSTSSDDQFLIGLLDRMIVMLTWPHVLHIDTWIVCFMRGLASVGRYRLLSQFACTRIDQVKRLHILTLTVVVKRNMLFPLAHMMIC
jgi:hypothetical protein